MLPDVSLASPVICAECPRLLQRAALAMSWLKQLLVKVICIGLCWLSLLHSVSYVGRAEGPKSQKMRTTDHELSSMSAWLCRLVGMVGMPRPHRLWQSGSPCAPQGTACCAHKLVCTQVRYKFSSIYLTHLSCLESKRRLLLSMACEQWQPFWLSSLSSAISRCSTLETFTHCRLFLSLMA